MHLDFVDQEPHGKSLFSYAIFQNPKKYLNALNALSLLIKIRKHKVTDSSTFYENDI